MNRTSFNSNLAQNSYRIIHGIHVSPADQLPNIWHNHYLAGFSTLHKADVLSFGVSFTTDGDHWLQTHLHICSRKYTAEFKFLSSNCMYLRLSRALETVCSGLKFEMAENKPKVVSTKKKYCNAMPAVTWTVYSILHQTVKTWVLKHCLWDLAFLG